MLVQSGIETVMESWIGFQIKTFFNCCIISSSFEETHCWVMEFLWDFQGMGVNITINCVIGTEQESKVKKKKKKNVG